MTSQQSPKTLTSLVARARATGPVRVAVADAAQEVVLATMRRAKEEGLAEPHLVGPRADIEPLAAAAGLGLDSACLHDSGADADAARVAVRLVREGKADVVMKGNLHTDVFMRVLLDAESGLRVPDQRVSHLFQLEVPGHERLIGITDAAINIAPDLAAKAQICQNAVDAFRAIGVDKPRAAVLSAVETVTASIGSTLDAASLTLMARRGQITGALVDGPLAFGNAVSPLAVAEKGIVSDVAGCADILLVPDLVSGNMLAKALEYLGRAKAAAVALGLAAPVVLTSRADTEETRIASLALASLLWRSGGAPGTTEMGEELHRTLRPAPMADADCHPLPLTKAKK
ncbi:bifunctional enoyl-CoA hydratase/phosphate acetyltransferase [Leisingera aquimarina]|uniref:bifunctional enoyl-CoA hydratase/phosphate acetyltransferase n=1 Tax=Leisingera aquimarina TaxID=476529 RepID=UPI001B7FC686|nr:bifunctional enoyl-CoA hydratase/phosphate acetyltransferase [Leisingera aquimarina]